MTTVFYRGERRDVKSFTPEEHQDYLDKKQHTINEAKEAIAGMKARIAELERIQAMNPIRLVLPEIPYLAESRTRRPARLPAQGRIVRVFLYTRFRQQTRILVR